MDKYLIRTKPKPPKADGLSSRSSSPAFSSMDEEDDDLLHLLAFLGHRNDSNDSGSSDDLEGMRDLVGPGDKVAAPVLSEGCHCFSCGPLGNPLIHRQRGIYHAQRPRTFGSGGWMATPMIPTANPASENSQHAATAEDGLAQLPTEIRLMIFERLLLHHGPVVRGKVWAAWSVQEQDMLRECGRLSVGILATCRRYHDEAAPILYGQNELIFGTSFKPMSHWEQITAGYFERFPVSPRYMPLLKKIRVCFQVLDPRSIVSRKVANFISALGRFGENITELTITAASNRFFDEAWEAQYDLLEMGHPIVQQIIHLLERGSVKNLNLRLHDGASFAVGVPDHLRRGFNMFRSDKSHKIRFLISCSCPNFLCPSHGWSSICRICGKLLRHRESRPFQKAVRAKATEVKDLHKDEIMEVIWEEGLWDSGGDDDDDDSDKAIEDFPDEEDWFQYETFPFSRTKHWPLARSRRVTRFFKRISEADYFANHAGAGSQGEQEQRLG